jgi:hypothetical protein
MGRELRARARGQAVYWLRFAAGLTAVVISLPQMITAGFIGFRPSVGESVFLAATGAAFLLTSASCLLSADLVSSERRSGTLDLLLATRLSRMEIILGKLGSVGVSGACALLAFVPILTVPLLVGGVTGAEALRKCMVLGNTLFLGLCAGLWASSSQRERSRAARSALLLMLSIVLGPFLVMRLFGFSQQWIPGSFSPLVTMDLAADSGYKAGALPFWCSLAIGQCMGWALLYWASRRLDREVLEEPPPAPQLYERRLENTVAAQIGTGQLQSHGNPIEWLTWRQYRLSALFWTIALFSLAFEGMMWLGAIQAGRSAFAEFAMTAWPLGVVAGLLGGSLVAWFSSRFLLQARRSGELELLVTTPEGGRWLVEAQWKFLRRLFPWPVVLMQAPVLLGILVEKTPSLIGLAGTEDPLRMPLAFLMLANSFMCSAAICWFGLYFGSRARSQAGALAWALALGKAVPMLLSGAAVIISQTILSQPFQVGARANTAAGIVLWVTQGSLLLYFAFSIHLVQRRLRRELRVTEPAPALHALLIGSPAADESPAKEGSLA